MLIELFLIPAFLILKIHQRNKKSTRRDDDHNITEENNSREIRELPEKREKRKDNFERSIQIFFRL